MVDQPLLSLHLGVFFVLFFLLTEMEMFEIDHRGCYDVKGTYDYPRVLHLQGDSKF